MNRTTSRESRRLNLGVVLIALAFAATTANAGDRARNDRLYRALGEREGIARITEEFTAITLADPRIGPIFEESNISRFKQKFADQICMIAGGPCVYDGLEMQEAHAPLDLTTAHFNAVVEHLQLAMRREGVPYRTQNKLLARLAPMHREIVTRRGPMNFQASPPAATAEGD